MGKVLEKRKRRVHFWGEEEKESEKVKKGISNLPNNYGYFFFSPSLNFSIAKWQRVKPKEPVTPMKLPPFFAGSEENTTGKSPFHWRFFNSRRSLRARGSVWVWERGAVEIFVGSIRRPAPVEETIFFQNFSIRAIFTGKSSMASTIKSASSKIGKIAERFLGVKWRSIPAIPG